MPITSSDQPITQEIETAAGTARTHLFGAGEQLLVLGHGAGGGIGVGSHDLLAARRAALALGWRVALVEQPWLVRGRRVAEAPSRLDAAWVEVLTTLAGTPLVVGGRSAGARVACRTATQVGAAAVLCLAFPLHPPRRPDQSRAGELALPTVPVLVIQGDRDAFGVPNGAVLIPGADHAFAVRRHDPAPGPQIESAVGTWLEAVAQLLT